MPEKLSYKQTLQMRQSFIGKSCKLHFDVAPLKIARASKQYMYDEVGNEYLDCINNVSHVGHCHSHVVSAGQEQMAKLCTSNGFLSENLSLYAKKLTETLPDHLCVCYFVNSGSEANDLALRLAKAYTKHKDFIVVENAYHGNLGNLLDISPLKFKKLNVRQKDHVHVVPCPDTYRGKYREDCENPGLQYAEEVKKVIKKAHEQGRNIAAFVHEPLLSLCGVVIPPGQYNKHAYRFVREAGGICIADEVQVGLGRIGDNYWAFQSQDIIPDIVTCGKPLGNGHPMAVVITTKEIADGLGDFTNTYGGNPVSCAIGLAVLDVMQNEQLLSSAKNVGRILVEGFKNIMPRHPMMGDVRGQGLVVGVELVTDKESRKPASEAAELLAYKMKQEKILMSNEGPDKNVMFMTPPMCFTCDNARRVISVLDRCLAEIESGIDPDKYKATIGTVPVELTELNIPLQVLSGEGDEDSDQDDPECKRARYEDMD